MIAFGSAVTATGTYDRFAARGIRLAAEPDSVVMPMGSCGSIFRNYNLLIDQFKDRDDVEALVLLHQDAEIVDPDFCAKVREAISDPEVALVGCAGAIGVRSIAWWEGSVTWASFTHRFEEEGGGDVPALTWDPEIIPDYAHLGEVDAIDGFVMALTPWAMRELRFDESLGNLHGYDFDLCLQARSKGRKVVTADLRMIHHHTLELMRDVEGWIAAQTRLAEKWEGHISEPEGSMTDWKDRARRAEAEVVVERIVAFGAEHIWSARVDEVEEHLENLKSSASWKVTAPFRWVKRLFVGRGSREDSGEGLSRPTRDGP